MCYVFLLLEKVNKKRTPIIRKNRILIHLTDFGLRLSITRFERLEEGNWREAGWENVSPWRLSWVCIFSGDFNSINFVNFISDIRETNKFYYQWPPSYYLRKCHVLPIEIMRELESLHIEPSIIVCWVNFEGFWDRYETEFNLVKILGFDFHIECSPLKFKSNKNVFEFAFSCTTIQISCRQKNKF